MEKTVEEIAREIRGQEREVIDRELDLEEAAIHLAVETGFFYDLKHLKYYQRALLILTKEPDRYRHLFPLCLRIGRELRCPISLVAFWFWRHRKAVQRLKTPLAYKIAKIASCNKGGEKSWKTVWRRAWVKHWRQFYKRIFKKELSKEWEELLKIKDMGLLDYFKSCVIWLQTHRAIQHRQGKGWEGIFTDIFWHIDWQEIK